MSTEKTHQQFGRLTVRKVVRVNNRLVAECVCSCGNTKTTHLSSLKRGKTKSCGCLRKERTTENNITHGMSKTPTYRSWVAMWARCTNPARAAFSLYALKGVSVCARWKSFENFLVDMGERPENTSLERKDNSKGYSKANCLWADRQTQAWNRRSTVWVSYKGVRMPRSAWAEKLGVSDGVLARRLAKFPPHQAIQSLLHD